MAGSDKKSKISNALPIVRIKPPQWTDIFTDGDDGRIGLANGCTFDNIFIYNFYTNDERDRYSFDNPNFSLDHVESGERSTRI